MRFVAGQNQPDIYADLISHRLDAAFKDVLHIEFLPDFRGRLSQHDSCGRRSDDAEMLGIEPPELRSNHVSQAGAEVILLGIIAAIGEGKHDDTDLFRAGG